MSKLPLLTALFCTVFAFGAYAAPSESEVRSLALSMQNQQVNMQDMPGMDSGFSSSFDSAMPTDLSVAPIINDNSRIEHVVEMQSALAAQPISVAQSEDVTLLDPVCACGANLGNGDEVLLGDVDVGDIGLGGGGIVMDHAAPPALVPAE